MCKNTNCEHEKNNTMFCKCGAPDAFFSKKGKIESLKKHLVALEDKATDIKEYIRELESDLKKEVI